MRTNEANVWRRNKIDALVATLKGNDHAATETAMLAVRIPGSASSGAGVGFCVNDLRYHMSRTIDRADYLESVRARKESALSRLKGATDRRTEKAERLTARATRLGGTVSREEYVKVRDVAQAASKEAGIFSSKLSGLNVSVTDLATTIDALMGAAMSIKALIDTRAVPVMQSDRTQIGVVVATAEPV